MHQFPAWRYWLVATVMVLGIFFALPTVFGEDPALHIARVDRQPMDTVAQQQVLERLKASNVAVADTYQEDGRLVLRFTTQEQQAAARDSLSALAREYSIALARAPAAPRWLLAMGSPIRLGLDLRGGVRFLFEVDVDGAVRQAVERLERNVRLSLREERIPYGTVVAERDGIRVTLKSAEQLTQAVEVIRKAESGVTVTGDAGDEPRVIVRLTPDAIKQRQDGAIEQNIITLRNRVNELGVSEASVVRQGRNRIEIQIPGIDDPNQAMRVLSATTSLEWHMVDEVNDPFEAERTKKIPLGSRLSTYKGQPILIKRELIVTGGQMEDARTGTDQNGLPAVHVTLNAAGGRAMLKNTQQNVGKLMAVLSVERRRIEPDEPCRGIRIDNWCTTDTVISSAVIQGVFSDRFIITGLSSAEAQELALLLRAGSLEAPIDLVSQKQIGATLGRDNIENGIRAMVLGMLLTFAFMAAYYRWFGLIACAVLTANVILLVAIMAIIGGVLTLPGIAGIVLTVGMAADANVLIYERIREELRIGNTPQAAIHAGFDKAFSAIADSNITTLIAGVVLFAIGTGPVKGFAVTLVIGIATSLFTAILGSRALIQLIWGGKRKIAALPV